MRHMNPRRYELVLSIYLTTRGFAFALFEGPLSPVDWGTTDMRGLLKNRRCHKAAKALLTRYKPDVLVLQDMGKNEPHRILRIRLLNIAIARLAENACVPVLMISRARLREHFASRGTPTKQGIAELIAKHIPAFERYLPRKRKPWMSEDKRMALFDAAALALTAFQISGSPPDQ